MIEFLIATVALGAFGGLARLAMVSSRKPEIKVTLGQIIRHCYLGAFAATLILAINMFANGVYFEVFIGLASGMAYAQAINSSLPHAGYSREEYVNLGNQLPDS